MKFKENINWTCAIRLEMFDSIHSTVNVRFHIGDFFQYFSYPATYVYVKGYTHHSEGQEVITVGKSAKQICLKKLEVKLSKM